MLEKFSVLEIIAIVKQVAEENNQSLANNNQSLTNDSWIPCSVRLPERIDPFQTSEYTITMQFVKNGKKGKPFTSHASFDYEAGKWLVKEYEVIAWQPLPAPYQPKGNEKNCNSCANHTDFDEVDNGCYMCCKGLENNYQPKGDQL